MSARELRNLPVALQGLSHRVAAGSDRAGDPSKRFALSEQSNSLGSLPSVEPGRAPHDAVVGEVTGDGGAVHLVLDGEICDRRAAEVFVDELVHLRGGEKGLNSCNRPHDRPTNVADRGLQTPLRGTVDATLPALDQRILTRGKVCEEKPQGPQYRGANLRLLTQSRFAPRFHSGRFTHQYSAAFRRSSWSPFAEHDNHRTTLLIRGASQLIGA